MSFLKNVQSGAVRAPYKIVVYGMEGVGKSTFASNAPSPIFLDVEGGTGELDVKRLTDVETFGDTLKAIDELIREPHEFKTFVLDTADWLESKIWDHVCVGAGVKSIEDIGYGKGYTSALEWWRTFLARLDELRSKRGMNVVLLAHSHIRSFKNPAGDDYDKYELKMHAKASAVLKEWSGAILFARYQIYTVTDKQKRTRAVGDGSRVLSTEPRPAWEAKNRYSLPEEIPLSWQEFDTLARGGAPSASESARDVDSIINELLQLADAKTKVNAEGMIKRAAGDVRKLNQLVDWLRNKTNQAA